MTNRLQIGDLQSIAIVSDLPIVTTFEESDIREPEKAKASSARSVELYETNEINQFFENIFEVNIATNTFNANIKTSAKYFEDEVKTFEGYLQLLRITIVNGLHVYSCNIIGETGNFWTDIGDETLRDLDYSDLDHDYTRANIIQSWDDSVASYGVGYYYPLVNRGTILGDESIWRVRDFLPCLYDYEYLTRILADKGYTLDSTHCDTEFFKRHITYPNLDTIVLSQAELDARQFNVGRSTDYTLFNNASANAGTVATVAIPFNKETAPFFDAGANFSGTDYTVPKTGIYNFSTKIKLKFTITHTNVLAVKSDDIKAISGSSNTLIYRNSNVVAQLSKTMFGIFNTNTGLTFANDNFKTNFENGTSFYTQLEISTGDISVTSTDILNARQTFTIQLTRDGVNPVRFYEADGTTLIVTGSVNILCEIVADDNNTMFYGLVTNKDLIEGDTVEMNSCVPVNIKQKDFIKSVMQTHNLIMMPDKTDPKKLIFEPYYDNSTGTSYYDGEIVNLGKVIDWKKEVVVNPMSELDAKTYLFKYKADKDYYNKTYEEKHSETFGTHEEILENDFIKATKTNELIWSPTHNVANYTLGIAYPKIYDLDNGVVKRITPNIRRLYAKIKTTSAAITFKEEGGTDLIIQEYGYAGHTDDPFTPTIDLNFGIPKQVFYSYVNAQWTTNNNYNRFHKSQIDQISDRDSKLIYANLWLKKTDIEKFSFRNRFFIEDEKLGDGYYRFNKIIEYVNEGQSVKCELLKLADIQVFTPSNVAILNEEYLGTERLISSPIYTPNKNVTIYSEYPVSVVASEDVVVGVDAQFISIIGSSGISVANGVTNVSVVNSSNIEVTSSNTSYVNGVQVNTSIPKVYKALLTQTGTSAPVATVLVNTLSGTPTLLYDGVGNYRVQLTGEFTVGKTFVLIGVPENNIGLIKRSSADDDINNLYLYTLLVDGTTFSNDILNCTILIEVYP